MPRALLLTGSSEGISLTNFGSAAVDFTTHATTNDGPSWILVNPATGTVQPQSTNNVSVGTNFAGLSPGVRTGQVQFDFANGTQTVAVYAINAGGSCQPTRLVPVLTSIPPQFNIVVGRPTPLTVNVVDDCGNPANPTGVFVTFDDADAPLNFAATAEGWMATWIPRTAS